MREFVGRYVDLSSNGSGLCPFHNDHVESFSVHHDRNFWKCFACGKSGSIVDFWMYYRDCDFNTAVKQLAGMLLLWGTSRHSTSLTVSDDDYQERREVRKLARVRG